MFETILYSVAFICMVVVPVLGLFCSAFSDGFKRAYRWIKVRIHLLNAKKIVKRMRDRERFIVSCKIPLVPDDCKANANLRHGKLHVVSKIIFQTLMELLASFVLVLFCLVFIWLMFSGIYASITWIDNYTERQKQLDQMAIGYKEATLCTKFCEGKNGNVIPNHSGP